MRIACPSCSVAYEVPDSLVAPGRVVRCARCGQEWAPVAAREQAAEAAAEAVREAPAAEREPEREPPQAPRQPPPLTAMDRLAAHPAVPQSDRLLQLAWALSLLLLVAVAGAGYVWRSEVMQAWPPSARIYAAFGVAVQAAVKGP